jgi:hypothetical protein
MPGGRTGWVGQWDHIEGAAVAIEAEGPTYNFVELLEHKKLCNRKFAHRDDKSWPQKIDFMIHPARAIPDLIWRRYAVAAGGRLTGEAAADRGEVNPGPYLAFTETTEFLEPTKKGAAGRPGERFARDRFPYAGRLTDEHYSAQDWSTGNRWRRHPRAASTLEQTGDVLIQQLLSARCQSHCRHSPIYRRKNDKIRLSTMLTMRQVIRGK